MLGIYDKDVVSIQVYRARNILNLWDTNNLFTPTLYGPNASTSRLCGRHYNHSMSLRKMPYSP